MRRFIGIALLLASLLIFIPNTSSLAGVLNEMVVKPDTIDVNTFFTGGEVTITGQIPEADDLVVAIKGPESNGKYDLIGRYGPFWMTREKVELENAPIMYMLLLPEGEEWAKRLETLGLGLDQLKDKISIQAKDVSQADVFKMFVELKEAEELYVEVPGAVKYSPAENGLKNFTATYDLPSSTTPGEYVVQATALKGSQKMDNQVRELKVREIGFIRFVHHLANEKRLTYGVLAVVIALLTGAVMGLLFKGGGSH